MRPSALAPLLRPAARLAELLCAACLARCIKAMVASWAPAECPISDICVGGH